MKTIKMTRTVRREVDGMFVYIGPKGIAFRQKHSMHAFPLSWKQIWNQAMLAAVAEEQQKAVPVVEVQPGLADPTQVPLFSDFHMGNFVEPDRESAFDEGVACEEVPGCDQEYPQDTEYDRLVASGMGKDEAEKLVSERIIHDVEEEGPRAD